MLHLPKINFQPYFEIAWRRKWWILIPFLLCLLLGGGYVVASTKLYRASTLILVESQRVPQSYVQPTVTESLHSRLQTISQQINSRTNLQGIIKEFNLLETREASLFERVKAKLLSLIGKDAAARKTKDASMLSTVGKVRNKINISLRGRNQAFEISFIWRDPQVAADVTNALASQFIEENLKVREEMAMGTTNFLDSEVDRFRKRLMEKEKALEDFKRKHMGMLPEQLQSNLSTLSQLREELNSLEKRIEMEKQQAMMIRNQMNMNEQQSFGDEMQLSQGEMQNPEVANLRDKLDNLRTRYTEKHPDIQALKRRIEKLQNQADADNSTEPAMEGLEMPDFSAQDMLRPQLEQIRTRIAKYEEQIDKVKSEIEKYKKRVEKTSEIELQLKNLQRDYNTIHSRYQSLLSKKLNAQMAEELEKRQKGEQFRIVDPAVPPGQPFKPDVKKILLMSLVLGLGMGGGLAYVRETIDPAFYTPEEVEAYLHTKVIVTLPDVAKDKKGS